ncbi:MAG: spermidine synthase [Planctomycetota bacterium]
MSIFSGLSLLRQASCVLLAAAAVFQAAGLWTALCGLSTASTAVLAGALAVAWGLAARLQRELPVPYGNTAGHLVPVLTATGLGLTAAAALPWILTQLLALAVGLFSIRSSVAETIIYGLVSLLPCGVLTILFAVCRVLHDGQRPLPSHSLLLIPVALPVVCLLNLAGISPVMLIAAFAGLAVVCVSLGAFPAESAAVQALVSTAGAIENEGPPWPRRSLFLGSGLSAGLLTVILFAFWGQLLPFTALQLVLLAAVTAAAMLGLRTLAAGHVAGKWLSAAGFLSLLLFAWLQPLLPEFFLAISETTERGLLQLVLRAAVAGVISALLACAWLLPRNSNTTAEDDFWFSAALAFGLPLGAVLTAFSTVASLLPIVSGLSVAAGFGLRLAAGESARFGKAGLRASVPLALALLAIPLAAPRFDLTSASRLLFAGRTLQARGRGLSMELIRHTEPARLAWLSAGASGELSVWRQSAVTFELLRGGVVTAKGSSDTRIQPQAPEEVLPAIVGLCNHPRPGRVLLLGDDSGAMLRTATHFPVQQILAVRADAATTAAASEFLWRHSADRPDQDSRVQLLHADLPLAVRDEQLGQFDVVVAAGGPATSLRHMSLLTREFCAAVHSRLNPGGVFCQRLTCEQADPELLTRVLATLSAEFRHAGVIQMQPGDFLLTASDSPDGLIHPQLLDRLQREHVQREAAACGWDWAQIAVLPLAESGGEAGVLAGPRVSQPLSVAEGGALLPLSVQWTPAAEHSEQLRVAFAPFQRQVAAAVPPGEAHEEAKRRLASLQQQVEILAGMPDQPWTYRRSLRMEMQRSPRPPVEKVEGGKIVRSTHPLDALRQDYFVTLGQALQSVRNAPERSLEAVHRLTRLAEGGEPLLGWFSHYEIVRLYELLQRPDPADELRHRLHLVFYAAPSDASVRPAIAALQMLVEEPQLIADPADRYDALNAVLQKLIERWEARTAWEPRSAARVQQDVDLSVMAGRQAMEQMQKLATAARIPHSDFLKRRQFVHAALISPLRVYCEQVLAHRMKTETPAVAGSEDPDDLPLLAPATGISTN